MSEPAPDTVNVLSAYDALPDRPTSPTSADCHGDGIAYGSDALSVKVSPLLKSRDDRECEDARA